MAHLNRREALTLLGAAGGAGLATARGPRAGVLAALGQSSAPGSRAVAFPKGAVIRTLLKDLPPEALAGGPVLFHEHLSMHYPPQEAGYADHVLLSSDFAVANSLKKNGGAGIGQAATVFGPMLLKAGLPEALLHRILVDNPRRFLAFVPV